MKPLIGITTQQDANPRAKWAADMYGQNRQYSDAVLGAGGLPVLLPFILDVSALRDVYERLDGILFAGGGDIDPERYGEPAGSILNDVNADRDTVELQLMKWAIAENKPVLAICRGLQVMNVALGGTLIQDILTQVTGAQNHKISSEKGDRRYMAHTVMVENDSRLGAIVGPSIRTNSHHHQAIKKPGAGLIITGRAEDGIIESAELAGNRFAIGVQSHPESLVRSDPGWRSLFESFVASCSPSYSFASTRKSSSTEVAAVLEAS